MLRQYKKCTDAEVRGIKNPRDTGNHVQIYKNSYPRRLSNSPQYRAENIKPRKKFPVIVKTKDSSEILVSHSDMYGMWPRVVWYFLHQRFGEKSVQMKKLGFSDKLMNFYFTS